MLRVTLYSGATREVFEFEDDERVTFGRSPNNRVILNANYVCRHHGEFVCEDEEWFVQDHRSKMGMTIIRGPERENVQDHQGAQRRTLKGRQTIQILNTTMRVEVNPDRPVSMGMPALSGGEPGVHPCAVTQMSDIDTLQQELQTDGHKLGRLYELAKDLNLLHGVDAVLERIAQTVFASLPLATYYAVCMHDQDSDTYIPRFGQLSDGTKLSADQITLSPGVIDQVLSKEMAMLFQSPEEQVASSKTIVMNRIWSSMAVPLRGSQGFVGVMLVDNRANPNPFTKTDLDLLMVLANSAAFALERARLQSDIQRMFDGFVDASVLAIEARDPTTSGHSRRVARLTVALGEAVGRERTGVLAPYEFTPKQLKEIAYAGLLHDFGKVGVSERVLIKADRLYPEVMERIRGRFKYIRASHTQTLLAQALAGGGDAPTGPEALRWIEGKATQFNRRLHEILEFIQGLNGAGRLNDQQLERLQRVARMTYSDEDGEAKPFLAEDEVTALSIRRGTLTHEERREIETHVSHTYRFLQQVPWSADLRGVADIVHAHHEKEDGSGYPRGLLSDEIPIQAKMLAVCDIFDAVTASDRPYRSAMPVEQGLEILRREAKSGRVDNSFTELFIQAGVWKMGA